MTPSSQLDSVRVVLLDTQDPVNIALTIRSMKNMGVSDLHLVRPCKFDAFRLEGIAHGTRDLIDRMQVHDTLDAAIADCVGVAAFIGKPRAAKWPIATPRQMAHHFMDVIPDGPVAMLFGREDWGLPNDAIDRATMAVTIPTTNHASLNLGQAVLVGCYELHLAAGDATRRVKTPRKNAGPATQDQYERTFADAEVALHTIDFLKTRNPELVMRSLRSMVFRANPTSREIDLLRAMGIEVQRAFARATREAGATGSAAATKALQDEDST